MDLSEDAQQRLLNASTYPGGEIGDGGDDDELYATGMLSLVNGTLTDEGAAVARQLKEAFWQAEPVTGEQGPCHGLSVGASGMLLNAERHTGGLVGLAPHAADEEELRVAGLVSAKGYLTARGARLARAIQQERWGDDE